jgi:hypothetical protein
MIKIPYYEDEDKWIKKIKKVLEPYGIVIVPFKNEDKLKRAISEDDADIYKAVLIDWLIDNELKGGKVAEELKRLKPYIKLYAVTQVTHPSEVAQIIKKAPFEADLLAKKDLEDEKKEVVKEFAIKLKNAVKEVEEILLCEPFIEKPQLKLAYLSLRSSSKWVEINEKIGKDARRIFEEAMFRRDRNLRDVLGLREKVVQIENILIARRVIFAEIFNREGKLHQVEHALGFYEKDIDEKGAPKEGAEPVYKNPNKAYVPAFKNYCSEIGIKPDEFRNSGKGVLPEEEKWLKDICKNLLGIDFVFPIIEKRKNIQE